MSETAVAGGQLPPAFKDLEPFLCWSIPSRADRFKARFAFSMDDIRRFYETMLPRFDEIMTYLNSKPLDALSPEDQRLLWMTLSLVEISRCVELWNGNDMPYYAHPKESLTIHI